MEISDYFTFLKLVKAVAAVTPQLIQRSVPQSQAYAVGRCIRCRCATVIYLQSREEHCRCCETWTGIRA